MIWKTIIIYYLGATLTVITYFAVAWWTGLVVDKEGCLRKRKLIVHSLVFLISFTAATLLIIRDLEIADISRYAGVLNSGAEILIPTDKPRITRLELGWTLNEEGISFAYNGGPFSRVLRNKFSGYNVFDEISLEISEKDNELKVSLPVRDETGVILAQLVDNEWKVSPPPKTLDRNYTKNMLEVVNEKGEVFLQVRVLKDKIQLNGVFYASNGHGIEIIPVRDPGEPHAKAKMHLIGPDTQRLNEIEPIFKYPSELHLGETR